MKKKPEDNKSIAQTTSSDNKKPDRNDSVV